MFNKKIMESKNMFNKCSYIYSDLVIELDTCNLNVLNCIKKQENAGRIRVLSKSKPYKVGSDFYTNVRYLRNK